MGFRFPKPEFCVFLVHFMKYPIKIVLGNWAITLEGKIPVIVGGVSFHSCFGEKVFCSGNYLIEYFFKIDPNPKGWGFHTCFFSVQIWIFYAIPSEKNFGS